MVVTVNVKVTFSVTRAMMYPSHRTEKKSSECAAASLVGSRSCAEVTVKKGSSRRPEEIYRRVETSRVTVQQSRWAPFRTAVLKLQVVVVSENFIGEIWVDEVRRKEPG